MTRSTFLQLRGAWLQVHKWIGLLLAVIIIPLSITGALLVWDEPVDRVLNPGRYAVSGAPALQPSAYVAAAQSAVGANNPISSLRYPDGASGPVVATATRASEVGGRPERTNVWLDPADARILDVASTNAGVARLFHRLHGSLLVPGWGRTIVGLVGVAMFFSCLTGIWLWWPLRGSVIRGLRWKRRNTTSANLHHLMGFWVLLPLAMLSFTGAWISFPQVFGQFESTQLKRATPDRARAARAKQLAHPATSVDAALAAALPLSNEARLATIGWPTDQASAWTIGFATETGTSEVKVDDASSQAAPAPPPKPETTARLMRRLHDGTGMGPIWQTLIFLGGIIPAILAVTGIMMWLRVRSARVRREKRRETAPAPVAAE